MRGRLLCAGLIALGMAAMAGCMEPGDYSDSPEYSAPTTQMPLPGGDGVFAFKENDELRGTVYFHSDGNVYYDWNDKAPETGGWHWEGDSIVLDGEETPLHLEPISGGGYGTVEDLMGGYDVELVHETSGDAGPA